MAEKLCTLRTKGGGGGKYTETSLWTNPSPSANFPQTTVTLSDSMNNYTYLGLEFKYSKDSTDTMTYYMKVEDFSKQATTGAGSMQVRFGGVGSITISRYVVKTSDTSITIGNGAQVGGTTTSTTIGIPLQIVGIKKGGSGTKAKTVHGTGTMSTSATTKITLNFRPDFVILEATKGNAEYRLIYDSAYGSSIQRLCVNTSGNAASYVKDSYPPSSTTGIRVSLLEDDGFTLNVLSTANRDAYGADFSYIAGKYEV